MTRDPNEEERSPSGGKAAERLREFLAARFGDKAPVIPPDEMPSGEESPDDAATVGPAEDAGAPPKPRQRP